LGANHQVIEKEIENNFENGEEYVKIIKTPYQNLMLDRQVLRIKESPTRHMLFIPQKVVRHEVWTGGL
jgi:hypothetical protein